MKRIRKTPACFLTALLLLSNATVAQWPDGQIQVYSLKHVQPSEARRMLTELLGAEAGDVSIIADSEKRELVVSGSEKVQRLAAQLLKQVDQSNTNAHISPEQPVLKTYPLAVSQTENRLNAIQQIAGPNGRVTVNQSRDRVIVVTTPAQHRQLQQALQSQASPVPSNSPFQRFDTVNRNVSANPTPSIEVADPSALFPGMAVRGVSVRDGAKTYRLQNITAWQCQHALTRLLGSNYRDLGNNQFRYTTPSSQLSIEFDTDRHVCHLRGDQRLIDQFTALLMYFERSQNRTADESFRFVPLRNVRPDVLNRALELWQKTSQHKQPRNGVESSLFSNRQSMIRPAGFVQDEPATSENGGAQNVAQPQADDDNKLRRPSSDVTVRPLPDLDVLILRGRDPDVEELVHIIQEIERLSDETMPAIEVYHLRHVRGAALNELIAEVLEDLTGPLQGRISITPLERPNALLLIGWGEAVKAAKLLIGKLDRPAELQMQVFALKHAPASSLSESISEFLNGRSGGLAPQVSITTNPRTNSLIVNASPRDMEEVASLVRKLDVGSSASVNKAKMVHLKNSLAADVAETISSAIVAARGGETGRSAALEMLLVQPDGEIVVTSGLLDSVTLTPDPRTNSIFITGPEDSLSLVERLIEQLDASPAASAQIKVFQISNGDASEMVIVLRSLFPEAATSSTVPQLASAEGETSLVPVRFSVDIRTNTIIATGTTGDLRIIEALLLRLDQTESQERVNRVYRLKNSPATDVAEAVNNFLRSERIVNQAAPGRQNPFQQIQQEVVVVPEPVRNSLIISATPRYFEQILELVEDLDDQPPQVMIQVIIAEVDLDHRHEFGIELGLQDSLLFDRSLLGDLLTTTISSAPSTQAGVVTTTTDNIIGASNSPGFDFNNNLLGNSGSTNSTESAGNVAGQALSHFSLGRVNQELEYGGLVLSASSENVSVLLRALDHAGSLEVLSRPQVMTLDNQQAFIQVGQRVPRIVSSQLTQLGQINSLALEDVGLLLGVTPRISPDGNVVMELDAEKSKVGPEREGIPISVSVGGAILRSPRVDVTTAQTTVSAASGQTIVIGGLITNSNESFSRKVPWLGDLPVLGHLFRHDGYSNRRKELLIILTPRVILGQGETEYLKQVEMSRMSWVSSDVFQWLDAVPADCGIFDDNGVPVIFPDEALQVLPPDRLLNPIPDPDMILPPQEDFRPVAPDPAGSRKSDLVIPTEGDLKKVSYESADDQTGVIPATKKDDSASSKPQGKRNKRGFFDWLRKGRE